MWIEELTPERLAEYIRHYHQALELLGKESGSDSWKVMVNPEKNSVKAAARLVVLELDSSKKESAKRRKYFAEPGKAEWGC